MTPLIAISAPLPTGMTAESGKLVPPAPAQGFAALFDALAAAVDTGASPAPSASAPQSAPAAAGAEPANPSIPSTSVAAPPEVVVEGGAPSPAVTFPVTEAGGAEAAARVVPQSPQPLPPSPPDAPADAPAHAATHAAVPTDRATTTKVERATAAREERTIAAPEDSSSALPPGEATAAPDGPTAVRADDPLPPVAATPIILAAAPPSTSLALATSAPVPNTASSMDVRTGDDATCSVHFAPVLGRPGRPLPGRPIASLVDGPAAQRTSEPSAALAAPLPFEPLPVDPPVVVQLETGATAIADPRRGDAVVSAASQLPLAIAARLPAPFAQPVLDVARDLAIAAGTGDVRFTVRPEALGSIAVTVARNEDGASVALGVETVAALSAMRAAEPLLVEGARQAGAPLVNVSVDLSAPRHRRPPPEGQRSVGTAVEPTPVSLPPRSTGRGRYA